MNSDGVRVFGEVAGPTAFGARENLPSIARLKVSGHLAEGAAQFRGPGLLMAPGKPSVPGSFSEAYQITRASGHSRSALFPRSRSSRIYRTT